jgi:leucyl/phenylalanyl-tRNA--protein transferase
MAVILFRRSDSEASTISSVSPPVDHPVEPPASPWHFPDVRGIDDDLVAVGADLAPGTLLAAYRAGLFPMPLDDDPTGWFSPVRRGVLPLGGLKVSKSLRRSFRDYEIRVDTAFAEVIEACADPSRDGGWIDDEILDAYGVLHDLGWAHSVEAWHDGELAGGLYGIAIGGLFAGESMFHRRRDASKAALVGLVGLLRDGHAERRLLDVQWRTDHLASLGVVEIPRREYLDRLRDALTVPLPVVPLWRAAGSAD